MSNHSPDRLEIFLALALKQTAKREISAEILPATSPEKTDFMLSPNPETEPANETVAEKFPVIFNFLYEPEIERFGRLWADYLKKTEAEKGDWRSQILKIIGNDQDLIDEQVHQSHISEALDKEIPRVREIIAGFLPQSYKILTDTFDDKKEQTSANAESQTPPEIENSAFSASKIPLEKAIRRAFAKQFVSIRDLEKPTAFDRLNGAQLARLIRLTGIREIALACVRIEAVESVAAFLRIFSTEDAQAIAAQLNSLAEISEARLTFAEHIVQTMLESEPQPSAMLDLIGIRLNGIALCGEPSPRIRYTIQKLPLEIAPNLMEIIVEQSVETPIVLQRKIKAEIQHLAETLVLHAIR